MTCCQPLNNELFDWANEPGTWRIQRWGRRAVIGLKAEAFAIPLTLSLIYLGNAFGTVPTVVSSASSEMSRKWEIISACVIAPLGEEAVFRGLLQPLLINSTHKVMGGEEERRFHAQVVGVMLQATVFGMMHGNSGQRMGAAIGGLLYGYMRERCEGSIVPGIAGHALWNGSLVGIGLVLDTFLD